MRQSTSPLRSQSPRKSATTKRQREEQKQEGLCCLVKKKDRLRADEVIEYFKMLVKTADKLKDPLNDIETIFKKIEAWKDSYGNLDQQEKMIAQKFDNSVA